MSSQRYDVFVSYSKHDRARVILFVDALEAVGLTVFWDKKIPPGATWAQWIGDALAASSFVVLCLTPSTVTSSFVEAEIRHSQDRVIPALFEPTGLPLEWEALIGRIQRVDLTQSRFNPEDPQFSRLLSVLTGQTSEADGLGLDELEAQARQLIENSSPKDRCLAIALAVMGGASSDVVSTTASYFESLLMDEEDRAKTKLTFEPFNKRLARLGAEQFTRPDARFNVQVTCARYVNPALSHRVFALSWSDYEPLRDAIIAWIVDWSADTWRWIRLRLALSLGVLAQDEGRFDGVWRRVLRPMLFDNTPRRGTQAAERFDVADAALFFAAKHPERRQTVEEILKDLISEQSRSRRLDSETAIPPPAVDGDKAPAADGGAKEDISSTTARADAPADAGTSVNGDHLASGGSDYIRSYVLARLAFGETGATFPDLAIKALKRLADKNQHQVLVRILETSFRDAISTARETGDLSLRNPMDLLSGLLKWAHDALQDDAREDMPLPLEIFAYGLSCFPLHSDDPTRFSLAAILKSKRGIACLRWGFLAGLALPETRDTFEKLLRDWRDLQAKEKCTPDPVMALACVLIHGTEAEQDRERVRFIFRNHYDERAISSLAEHAPVLTDRSTSCLSK
jgi:hypothetical protein